MRQPLTIGLAIAVLVTATAAAFVVGYISGQNSFSVKGIPGKVLLYLEDNEAVEGLSVDVSLRGQVVQKEADVLLIKAGESPGIWATLTDETLFEESTSEEASKKIDFNSINVGDKVVVLGNLEGDTIVADVVIRVTEGASAQ